MIQACFAEEYCVESRSGSMTKLAAVAREGQARHLLTLVDPGIMCLDHLFTLHDPEYVQAFLSGELPLAISQNLPWSPQLRRAVLSMQAGQLKSARIALQDGIAGHIANGFHHARYARGRGFCTFNGLALIARAFPQYRVFVLDCDDHGGDGTEDFAGRLDNLFNYSIFFTRFGCKGGVRSFAHEVSREGCPDAHYQQALSDAFESALQWKPHLLIYQAGVDSHVNDALGSKTMTTEALYQRDLRVFSFCRHNHLPVFFTLAGGYQTPEAVTELHLNTFLAAIEAGYSPDPNAQPPISDTQELAQEP